MGHRNSKILKTELLKAELLGARPLPWSFRPMRATRPPDVQDPDECRDPLDRFIHSALESARLPASPAASRRSLIRRVTFDLLGLPPAPAEVKRFLTDSSPDALGRAVDRLLASPRYGERWGRHWLDVARYADSNGLDENVAHGNAWRYRDYVVGAFNDDLPYDVFLREQIAGDLLGGTDEEGSVSRRRRIATGFLSLGPKVLAEGDQAKLEMDIIDEQIDTIGRAFLGLTIGCARCHDHKYDPLSTRDYYAIAGIFKSTRTMETLKRVARWYEHALPTANEIKERADYDRRVIDTQTQLDKLTSLKENGADASADVEARIEKLRADLDNLKKTPTQVSMAMGVKEGETRDLRVHIRGSHLDLGEPVARGVPELFSARFARPVAEGRSGREALAAWLTHPEHPLTARVFVNRIWRWHFGVGLVRTPDNFGNRGAPPRLAGMLDWLAARFTEDGWSTKRLHRRILLSATYRRGGSRSAGARRLDPENELHSYRSPRRLEAEAIRDSFLFVAGVLDNSIGGPSLQHVENRGYLFDHTSRDTTRYDTHRRSLYLPVIRNHVCDALHLFDFPDPAVPNGDRSTSTVAPQALFLLNSEFALDVSRRLAVRLLEREEEARLTELYMLAYGRPPSRDEQTRATSFLLEARSLTGNAAIAAEEWALLCQVILSANEFVYID